MKRVTKYETKACKNKRKKQEWKKRRLTTERRVEWTVRERKQVDWPEIKLTEGRILRTKCVFEKNGNRQRLYDM